MAQGLRLEMGGAGVPAAKGAADDTGPAVDARRRLLMLHAARAVGRGAGAECRERGGAKALDAGSEW